MALYEHDCRSCGVETTSARIDAKCCRQCSIQNGLTFARHSTKRVRKCRMCAAPYLPYRAGDLTYCAACLVRQSKRTFSLGECKFCEQPSRPLVNPDVPICLHCIKDPKEQGRVLLALIAAFDRRYAEHGHKTADPRPPTPVDSIFEDDPCAPAI